MLSKFLGLEKAPNTRSQDPAFSTRLRTLALQLALALAAFFLFRWLLSDTTGFASYVPYLAAASTLLISQLVTQLARLEAELARKQKGDEPPV